MKTYYVVASFHEDFLKWCKKNKIKPANAVFVNRADRIRGKRLGREQIVFLPSWMAMDLGVRMAIMREADQAISKALH